MAMAKITLQVFDEKTDQWITIIDDKIYEDLEFSQSRGVVDVGRSSTGFVAERILDGSETVAIRLKNWSKI